MGFDFSYLFVFGGRGGFRGRGWRDEGREMVKLTNPCTNRYGNVSSSEVFASAWPGDGGLDDARAFIAKIETLRKGGRSERDLVDEKALEKLSRQEIEAVAGFCEGKFGVGEVRDASQVWVQPSPEVREMGSKMVIGGEGWRTF